MARSRGTKEPKYVREAEVQREVLRALGTMSDVLILSNEVGMGYPRVVRHTLEKALQPWGPECVATLLSILDRNTMSWGLGKGSPDLVGGVRTNCCGVARAVGLELKRPVGGVVSDDQALWHAAARRRGVAVATVTSAAEAANAVSRWRLGGVE